LSVYPEAEESGSELGAGLLESSLSMIQLEADPISDSAVVVDTCQTLCSKASIGRNTLTILAPQEPPNTEAMQPILDLIHVDVSDGAEDYKVVDLYTVMGGASAVDPTEDVPSCRHPLLPSPADV
jgi:hypothetical protein